LTCCKTFELLTSSYLDCPPSVSLLSLSSLDGSHNNNRMTRKRYSGSCQSFVVNRGLPGLDTNGQSVHELGLMKRSSLQESILRPHLHACPHFWRGGHPHRAHFGVESPASSTLIDIASRSFTKTLHEKLTSLGNISDCKIFGRSHHRVLPSSLFTIRLAVEKPGRPPIHLMTRWHELGGLELQSPLWLCPAKVDVTPA